MSTLRYRIMPHSEEAPFSLPELFADLAVADICDALGRNAALPSAIKPLGVARLLGTAYTVNLPAGENLLLWTMPGPATCWPWPATVMKTAPCAAR